MQFRNLETQYLHLKDDIHASLLKVFESGTFIGGSPVKEIEGQLAKYVGVKHCITCGNGTDALQLALMAWGIGSGDAVIVPDFTFFSSGEVVSAVGATPVFVDVDARTFNIDPSQIKPACQMAERQGLEPRAVVAVDLFGLPANYQAIREACDSCDLLLLEDGAQGFGGSIAGKMACSFGDISTTSFFPAKPLGCYGDGGAIFTENDDWCELIRSYAVHGKGSMKYDNVRIGMNSRLDAVQAAILQVKLRAFAANEVDAVNKVAHWYYKALCDVGLAERGVVLPLVPDGYHSSWAQYTIQLPDGCNRGALQSSLKKQGIPTMVYYPKPMHMQRAFKGACLRVKDCPTTTRLCDTVLSLPMGPYTSNSDVEFTAERLARYLDVAR